jgi:hypothetical protein
MNPTIKAILARFNGDVQQAYVYCLCVCADTNNDSLKKEYWDLSNTFRTMEADEHERTNRVRTVFAPGCCA